jgi:hypothetical protein
LLSPGGQQMADSIFEWTEHGGPPAQQVPGKGFGMRLFQSGLRPFRGSVDIQLGSDGLHCRMSLLLTENGQARSADYVAGAQTGVEIGVASAPQ